jgi:formylglycine-generating enzyme required for sulfatase activity
MADDTPMFNKDELHKDELDNNKPAAEAPDIIQATPFSRTANSDGPRGWGRVRQLLRPVPLMMSLLFIGLALAVLFIFSARAVRFEVQPAAASITITSGWFTYQLGERYLMLPGSYGLAASAEGYEPLATSVTVGPAADQNFTFVLPKLPGKLMLSTTPDTRTEVYVNQQAMGFTPVLLQDLAAGQHDISLRPQRYLRFDTQVEIQGMGQTQTLAVPLQPAWATLGLTTKPAGATISIDGVDVGVAPASIEVLQGQHELQVHKPGFKNWQMQLDVVAQVDQVLPEIVLEVKDGKLSINSDPAGASVTIGSEYRGQTPLKLVLAPGKSYRVRISKAGFEPIDKQVTINADTQDVLNNQLQPILGILNLQVQPADAQLFVDGKPFAMPANSMPANSATVRLSLSASPHQIRLVKPGYATYQTSITPQPGLAQQLLVQLQTEDAARVAQIPTSITSSLGPVLQLILPGQFAMGAERREPGRRSNEIEKQVELTRPYYLGIHEITNEQYKRFDSQHDSGILGRAVLTGDDRPVVNLAWDDAVRFCNWLSQRDGLPLAYEQKGGRWQTVAPMTTGYRLPTEAEWAWAGRYAAGPKPTRFPWGDVMPPTSVDANYADVSAENMVTYTLSGYNDHFRGPAPVGSFSANAYGLFDMAGNVSEWIHDYYGMDTPTSKLTDPLGPDTGEYHVIKGSNYTHGRFSELRWAYRDYGSQARTDVGFRIARYSQ